MSVLHGIRVLDFGRYVAGPYCATLLGYLGAEVIRVERRDGGEDRYIAPLFDGGEGGVFFQTACNKKSVTLDPASPSGREIVRRLVATADIVVVNLPPSALTSLGLDYESLRAIKPDLILATQTAFGDSGPYRDRGGFDGIGQALSGAMAMTGTPGHPVKAAAPYVDFSTAVLSAFGTLAALIHRMRTGEGQHVQATLQGTALSVFASHLIEQSVTQRNRVGTGNRVQTSAPSDVFATAFTPPSVACAVVTNLPSAEIKKPLSVRNKLPLESKVDTQITEGRTLASTFANSDDGVKTGVA